jgi:hypothetical protein
MVDAAGLPSLRRTPSFRYTVAHMTIVHLKGAIRPFALCHSFTAAEKHVNDRKLVTCDKCLALLPKACPKCGSVDCLEDAASDWYKD